MKQEDRYLRIRQIVGQIPVSPEQAEQNRQKGRSPRTPRPHIDPIIPVSRSGWWAGVKSGKYPKPIKLGERTTVWKASEVLALIDAAGGGGHEH